MIEFRVDANLVYVQFYRLSVQFTQVAAQVLSVQINTLMQIWNYLYLSLFKGLGLAFFVSTTEGFFIIADYRLLHIDKSFVYFSSVLRRQGNSCPL